MKTTYFVVMTDQHIVEPNQTLYGLNTQLATRRLIDSVRDETVAIAGILCLGDLADTVLNPDRMTATAGHEAYTHAKSLLSELDIPVLALAGNHDDPEIMEQYFPNTWTTSNDGIYVSNCMGTDFIGIDVRTGPEPTGYASSQCLEALDTALAESDRALLFSHYPLFDLDNTRIDTDLSTLNRDRIAEVVSRHRSKVRCAFHGHLHLWISTVQNNIVSYGVPSSSFTFILEPQSSKREVVGANPCGYFLLGIKADGTIVVRPRFLSES